MISLKGVGVTIVVAAIAVLAVVAPAQAQTTPTTPSETPTNNPETPSTQPSEGQNGTRKSTAARCLVAETRIEARSTKLATTKDTHDKKFHGIIERLTKLTEKAKTQGYDVAELSAAQASAQAALDAYKTAFTAYKTTIASTKTLACGESDGAFATSLTKARTELVTARTAATTLKTTITKSVVPAIKDYAAWLKVQASNSTAESEPAKPATGGTN